MILVNNDRRQDWLVEAVHRRLREELAKLDVRLNEDKSRIVDLSRGESFGFLGFDFRRVRSFRGRWRPQYTPKPKKRTALLQELKAVFRRYRSQPVEELIAEINPKLRGWVNYFRIGHASRCFAIVQAVGRAEGTAPSDAGEESSGLRLEEVEYGMAPHHARVVRRLPSAVSGAGLKALPADRSHNP